MAARPAGPREALVGIATIDASSHQPEQGARHYLAAEEEMVCNSKVT
jgi:hypothetical protein